MVKVGFICEGETEKIIVESEAFQNMIISLGLEFVGAIDADGNGNLLPKNIEAHINTLQKRGAVHIIILTDLDQDACFTKTKARIHPPTYPHPEVFEKQSIVISAKKVEAWFLADSATLSAIFKTKFEFLNPEEENKPFESLKSAFLQYTGRGIGRFKPKVAKKMLKNGFSVEKASQHTNCPSAKYLVGKLKSLGETAK